MATSPQQITAIPELTKFVSWKLVTFYLGVPLAIALYGSINNWEVQQSIGYTGTLAFYLAHSFVPWWITCLSTYSLLLLLRKWRPPALLLICIGALLGCLLTIPYTNWITRVFESSWPTQSFDGFTTNALSTDFLIFFLRVVVIWIGVNFIFDRFVGLPRYRYAPDGNPLRRFPQTGAIDTPQNLPAFLARLPDTVTMQEVIAISAEQHYIRVHTDNREHMILYRFSDAINELGSGSGMQVHRSWWVAKAAIASVHSGAKKFYLQLDNGTKVPVSTPYQGMLRQFARAENIPVKPAAAA